MILYFVQLLQGEHFSLVLRFFFLFFEMIIQKNIYILVDVIIDRIWFPEAVKQFQYTYSGDLNYTQALEKASKFIKV